MLHSTPLSSQTGFWFCGCFSYSYIKYMLYIYIFKDARVTSSRLQLLLFCKQKISTCVTICLCFLFHGQARCTTTLTMHMVWGRTRPSVLINLDQQNWILINWEDQIYTWSKPNFKFFFNLSSYSCKANFQFFFHMRLRLIFG